MFEGAALLHAINQGQKAAEDFTPLHELHRTVMRAGCEMMGQEWLFSRALRIALAEVAEYNQDLNGARLSRRQSELRSIESFGHFIPICNLPIP